jgi:tetratricopeptide (TPR) repeat protein
LNLTDKQKSFIRKKGNKANSIELAKQFKVSIDIINDYVKSLSNKKTPKWFYLSFFIIPIIFFVLLEIGLQILNYGKNYSAFVSLQKYPGYLFFNPDYPQKYFENTTSIPSVIPDAFSEMKSDNIFRVFVLGGSTTAAFPFSYNASFSRYIKRRLEILYPQVNIEVINMGISAVNTYTVRDLVPQIIKQKPDLVLIYSGHNEYYGALGVGSTESIGNSRFLITLSLQLKNFKTYQLIENVVKSIKSLIFEKKGNNGKTLMAQMVGEKLIEYNSQIFNNGLNQFEENMTDILSSLDEAGVNTIISNLTCNLMQKPFESVESENGSADLHFNNGQKYFSELNYLKAKREFWEAIQLDALRFRAPSEINEIIQKLSNRLKIPIVDTDSAFSLFSNGNIIGYDLIVDHLHPNVKGHQIIGELFFDKMRENSFLPKAKAANISIEKQKDLALKYLSYTPFDSTYSSIVLSRLLNDYPFAKANKSKKLDFNLENFSDSIAEKTASGKISWEDGHTRVALNFFQKGEYHQFVNEMLTLIDDKPFIKSYYTFAINRLISVQKIEQALPILLKMDKMFHGKYSTKWLGTVALQMKLYAKAIYYFEETLKLNNIDDQIYFNISVAYFYAKEKEKAVSALQKCLSINPKYPNARKILKKLTGK